MTTTTAQGEDPLSGDRQPIDMKPSTDHLMQSMAIGYPGPRAKMDGKHDDGNDGDDVVMIRVGIQKQGRFLIQEVQLKVL